MAAKNDPLRTRLEPRRLGLLADDETTARTIKQWVDEDHAKLLALCKEMGVGDGPHQFYQLSLALAREYIHGFKERVVQKKWTDLTRGYLVVEVERLTADKRKQPGHSDVWACGVLAMRSEWIQFLDGGGGEALRVQYIAFKKDRWAKLMLEAFRLHKANGTVDKWDAELRAALSGRP